MCFIELKETQWYNARDAHGLLLQNSSYWRLSFVLIRQDGAVPNLKYKRPGTCGHPYALNYRRSYDRLK